MNIKPLPEDVLAAVQLGNTIEAIKLLRESSGLGLKEAKDAIDEHLRGNTRSTATVAAPGSPPAAVAEALMQGNKLEAIHRLRESTGMGLKEAKDAVESFGKPPDLSPPQRSPGEVPTSRTGIWLVVVLALAAALAYFLLRRVG
jgi:ribosomal protein L7/L12